MFAFADPEDHAIMVNDMVEQSNRLKREDHMKEIEKLARRHFGLRIQTVQSKIIQVLENQARDMQVTADNINSPFNAIKDNEIKGYLMYLLNMQEHHRRNVEKYKEKLKACNKQVHDAFRRLCSRRRDYAKIVRKAVKEIPATKTIEMYESRLLRITQKMGMMATDNEHYRREIHESFMFRRQHYCAYHALLKRNEECREIVSQHLDNAVLAYRSREEFIYKSDILKERYRVDMEKIRANNVLLHRIKERDIKDEEFEEIKSRLRTDCRSTEIEGMVKKGITGLEEKLEMAEKAHSSIVNVSGATEVDDIRLKFERQENENFNNFRYAENLNEEQDRLLSQVKILRQTIDKTEEDLGDDQKRSRTELTLQETTVQDMSDLLHEAVTKRDDARQELHKALDHLKSLCEFVIGTEEGRDGELGDIDIMEESTAAEKMSQWLANVEMVIGQNLMLVEYLHYLNIGTEEDKAKPVIRGSTTDFTDLETEESEDQHHHKHKDIPRNLSAESLKEGVMKDIAESDHFMDLDELQTAAHSFIDDTSSPSDKSASDESAPLKSENQSASDRLEDESASDKLEDESASDKLEDESAPGGLDDESATDRLDDESATNKLEDESSSDDDSSTLSSDVSIPHSSSSQDP